MTDWFMGLTEDDEQDATAERPMFGPPEDRLPGVVPFEVVLNQSPDVAVLLTGMRAFPSGVAMVLGVRLRRPVAGLDEDVFDDVFDHRGPDGRQDPAWQQGRLHWGFVLDGVEVDNLGATAGGIRLQGGGGSGSEQSCDRDFWLSSLPSAGPLEVWCSWPRLGLTRTTQTLDADAIVQAAARARMLWT